MKKIISIAFIVLRLFLGGFMIYGGVQKFQSTNPTPTEVVEKSQQFVESNNTDVLKIVLYINGLKQTGYFWELLGICELLFGFLLLIKGTSLIAALFLLPITLNIFLFHVFLEPHEISELLNTAFLFLINILIVLQTREHWKHLISFKMV